MRQPRQQEAQLGVSHLAESDHVGLGYGRFTFGDQVIRQAQFGIAPARLGRLSRYPRAAALSRRMRQDARALSSRTDRMSVPVA
jgi:hypothetical protein